MSGDELHDEIPMEYSSGEEFLAERRRMIANSLADIATRLADALDEDMPEERDLFLRLELKVALRADEDSTSWDPKDWVIARTYGSGFGIRHGGEPEPEREPSDHLSETVDTDRDVGPSL